MAKDVVLTGGSPPASNKIAAAASTPTRANGNSPFVPTNNNIHNHNNNNHNNHNNTTNGHQSQLQNGGKSYATSNDKQLLTFRSSLLSPNEVTFCDVSDDESSVETTVTVRGRRKRLNSSTDTDADSIMSSGSKNRPLPEIPDGGYGWVVVFCSVVVSLIADGISFSFGLLYTEFLVYFGESKSTTAWIGSIFLAVPLLSGPVMSNLVDKYGCRVMTIIGGVLSGIGFVLAALSNSVIMLYWTFGVIGGLGLGIGYVTAVCSVVGWFDKRRTFATGIGASGTGIGTFLYAPFTQYLIETFGWRGTCLILAGTLFNICVCGALMRDPEWLIESNRLESASRSQSMQTFSNSSVCLDEIKKLLEDGAPKEMVLDTLVTNYNTEANQQILGELVVDH